MSTGETNIDTRKTSAEKLEAMRVLANDMMKQAAREPGECTSANLTIWAERIHRVLDGEF